MASSLGMVGQFLTLQSYFRDKQKCLRQILPTVSCSILRVQSAGHLHLWCGPIVGSMLHHWTHVLGKERTNITPLKYGLGQRETQCYTTEAQSKWRENQYHTTEVWTWTKRDLVLLHHWSTVLDKERYNNEAVFEKTDCCTIEAVQFSCPKQDDSRLTKVLNWGILWRIQPDASALGQQREWPLIKIRTEKSLWKPGAAPIPWADSCSTGVRQNPTQDFSFGKEANITFTCLGKKILSSFVKIWAT